MIHAHGSVLSAQLEKGTEVYAINEIMISYSLVRREIPCRYLSVLLMCSFVLGQYFTRTIWFSYLGNWI